MPNLNLLKPEDARSFDEWFNLMWKEIVPPPTPPDLAEIKNRLWLALREHEELSCPHCNRKFPGESMTYADVTNHGYKCKQNPARAVALLLAELWNANVAVRQDSTLSVDLRTLEAKIAPELTRWGFGAAQATVPEIPSVEIEPDPTPEGFPIEREAHIERMDDEYPNKGVVKNHVKIGPSAARIPAYCVEWENGDVSNIPAKDVKREGA